MLKTRAYDVLNKTGIVPFGDCASLASAPTVLRNDEVVQELLDVISSIIADEYIQIAKKNPEVFKNNGGEK